MFQPRYRIKHDHFWNFGNQVTERKVMQLGKAKQEGYYGYHNAVVDTFNSWKRQSNQRDKRNLVNKPTSEEKCFLNLKKKKKRVVRCSRCL